MERISGTVSRGLRAPIVREGDNLEQIVTDLILKGQEVGDYTIQDRDVVGITESIVARVQGNYATVDQIAADVKNKFGGKTVGVIFPILSRNRFAICLRGIARGAEKVVLMLSYPSDEVGNHLLDIDLVDAAGINPYSDVLSEAEFEKAFGKSKHPFTGMDYVSYYKGLIEEEGAEAEIVFANNAKAVLNYTKNVLNCDIHTRERTKRILKEAGAEIVFGMDEILTESVDGSGYNTKYGLLGSNKATEETIKLFPNDCTEFVYKIQEMVKEKTGKTIEVMVY